MFQKYPLGSRLVIFLLLPLSLFALYVFSKYSQSLPVAEAHYDFSVLEGDTTLSWDQQGVARIQAHSEYDSYFATGFAHASDRLWQLEVQRRMAQGRLSEAFGSEYLRQDIWMRILGLENAAESSLEALSPEAISSLEAYSAGINAWLNSHSQLPPEFGLFDIKPKPWRPVDSLAWSKMFALNLSGNMFGELTQVAAKKLLPKSHFRDLLPTSPEEKTSITDSQEIKELYSQFLEHKWFSESVIKNGGKNVGSNAWAVAGKHTSSGRPLLANDPHLGLQIPSLWYMVEQSVNNRKVSGMSLVGLPLVIFGRNDYIAWGGTNMMADVQDLYIERVNPENRNFYMTAQGRWKEFVTQSHTIEVKAGFPSALREPLKPVPLTVRYTDNGPVISDFHSAHDVVLSLKWTALLEGDTTYEAFFEITKAQNWSQFNAAANLLQAPALNLLYIDENNIGYKGAGQIPIRNKGKGNIPAPAWSSEFRWMGFIPKDEMPSEFNPEDGIIVSANNDPSPKKYSYHLSSEWASNARKERIEQLLSSSLLAGNKLDLEDHQRIQADQYDSNYYEIVNRLISVATETSKEAALVDKLKDWDGVMEKNSVAALLAAIWIPELNKQLFDDELKGSYLQEEQARLLRSMVSIIPYTTTINALDGKTQADWCDNVSTLGKESCNHILKTSFKTSVDKLEKFLGNDIEDWQLGNAQFTAYEHFPLSQVKLIGDIFSRTIANGGSGDSVNVATSHFEKSKGLKQTFGAGFRQIMEAGQHGEHRYINSTGQSGNIFSQHYDDMVEPFNLFQYYKLEVSDKKDLENRYFFSASGQ